MSIFRTIGQGIKTFCQTVWNGLKAVWEFIKKVVTTLCDWVFSILGWLAKLAAEIAAKVAVGVIVIFLWIFGDDDDLEEETHDEKNLGEELSKKLNTPHKKIIVKGVFNKQTKQIEKQTEIEVTDKISSEIKSQTGGERFAEIENEE